MRDAGEPFVEEDDCESEQDGGCNGREHGSAEVSDGGCSGGREQPQSRKRDRRHACRGQRALRLGRQLIRSEPNTLCQSESHRPVIGR
jgi:hypothetical protein